MDLILCHTTADFDALGAAVGVARLFPGAKIVLTGGSHPAVRDFLALHRDEYPLIERRAVHPEQIRSLVIVDTQKRDRLGKAAEWIDLPQLEAIHVYDHHVDISTDIPATQTQIAAVGAATTLVVEELQQHNVSLNSIEATVMALGIHVDTGSLTFAQATARDAIALSWLMQQGANLRVIRDYIDPGLSAELQELLTTALANLQTDIVGGYTLAWVMLETKGYVTGLSSLASQLMEITESDALILAAQHFLEPDERLTIIGRSRIPGTNLNEIFQEFGGGGHSQAASISLRSVDAIKTLEAILDKLKKQTPQPPTARDLMSSPVRTIRPETTIGEAQRILLRYGHSGLCVADPEGQLVGIVSRRDLDIALHHGFSHAPVKGYMKTNVKTINPATTLPEIESLMVTYDIGRLPVLDNCELVGIVTRTDVLREIHQEEANWNQVEHTLPNYRQGAYQLLRDRLAPQLWELLTKAATHAQQRGWHLYLVGGAVRDLLLTHFRQINSSSPETTDDNSSLLTDIDLVVDGYVANNGTSAGVQLAQELQQIYPNTRLEVHGAFQTAALLWHKDSTFDSLWVDIATARTEFYPYPAANPEVEASSIRQDLYRRDFTINALAIRLTSPRAGELLDFFGGFLDLQAQQIRVLHANSFIEDPTRIYRAVRFAVRLDFTIEPETESYIRYCIASGIYNRVQGDKIPALSTRLKGELKYILQAPYWKRALQLLSDLGALKCIHPTLEPDRELWRQLRLLERCLQQKLDWQQNLPHWLLRLEAIAAHLSPEYRVQVATNLQLPDESIKRLGLLNQAQTEVEELLPSHQQPSQVVQLLRRYDVPMLILIAIRTHPGVRRLIWQYFTQWSLIEPPLNGNDLKALGYKPGPLYRVILDELLAATLDGTIEPSANPEELRNLAIAFVKNRYPQ
ncbi:CBS domain-containing protein [Gloeocapsopsis dulcis]|uniref:Poly(A) polymerase n=1 Tax=Gloeocapsopsis dulcis AAB1 = 1H9 TaxID=1433147 RepID=A0A6N8G2Q5_9CHRO|nr:CBS domain-containing protein [Gloeocapsopsis dulcis]MUL38835.1 poly(A) polymerase [Gloeocapsopsis dulcis AAB1 = 1H9]WNN91217.1 CBS domain-containing protein [Gloeocapsopsis dulcis]